MMAIKLFYRNETRRTQICTVKNDVTFDVLVSTAKNMFPTLRGKSNLEFYWTDEDNDTIVVSSDNELLEAARFMVNDNREVLRFEIRENQDGELLTSFPVPIATAAHEINRAVHDNVRCDGCDVSPIVGTRYKCVVLEDYDLCELCEGKETQPHAMIKIYTPDQAPADIMLGIRGERGTRGPLCGPHYHGRHHQGHHHHKHHHHGHHHHHHHDGPQPHCPPTHWTHRMRNPFDLRQTPCDSSPQCGPGAARRVMRRNERKAAEVASYWQCDAQTEAQTEGRGGRQGEGQMEGQGYADAQGGHGHRHGRGSWMAAAEAFAKSISEEFSFSSGSQSSGSQRSGYQSSGSQSYEGEGEETYGRDRSDCPDGANGTDGSYGSDGYYGPEGVDEYFLEEGVRQSLQSFLSPCPALHSYPYPDPATTTAAASDASVMSAPENLPENPGSPDAAAAESETSPPSVVSPVQGSVSVAPSVSLVSLETTVRFVRDVTFPDGTQVQPGSVFLKTWRIHNDGAQAWPDNVVLTCSGGDAMSASDVALPVDSLQAGCEAEVNLQLFAAEGTGDIMVEDDDQGWHLLGSMLGTSISPPCEWVELSVPVTDSSSVPPPVPSSLSVNVGGVKEVEQMESDGKNMEFESTLRCVHANVEWTPPALSRIIVHMAEVPRTETAAIATTTETPTSAPVTVKQVEQMDSDGRVECVTSTLRSISEGAAAEATSTTATATTTATPLASPTATHTAITTAESTFEDMDVNMDVDVDVGADVRSSQDMESSEHMWSPRGIGQGSSLSYANVVWMRLWAAELQILSEMGFTDIALSVRMLQSHMDVPVSLSAGNMETGRQTGLPPFSLVSRVSPEGMQRVIFALLAEDEN